MISLTGKVFVCPFVLALAGAFCVRAQDPAPPEPAAAKPIQAPAPPVTAPSTGSPQPQAAAPVQPGEDAFGYSTRGSILLYYWVGPGMTPAMRTGKEAATGVVSSLDYPGKSKDTPGIVISFPAGSTNAVRVSYFRTLGSGNATAPQDLRLYGQSYTAGDYLAVAYTLQNYKFSFDYLSWPFPAQSRSFRIRTLWELQYTRIQTSFDAPLKVDADGDLVFAAVKKSNGFFYPSIGLGLEKHFSRNVRWELKASGFAWPGKSRLLDGETDLAFRFGQFELVLGGKAFHFRTSPSGEEFVRGTLYGAFGGIRWYPGL